MSVRIGERKVKRMLVVGLGVTGKAVCRYAVRHDVDILVTERRALCEEERGWLREQGISYEERGHTGRALVGIDAIILSPSVPTGSALLASATQRGIPIYSELDLAAAASVGVPMVAVTGTNGKSTTVELIGALLRAVGQRVAVVGNIGTPFIDVVDADPFDAIVVEASSYQLAQSAVFRPDVALLLNLEPDHLAQHGTMHAYTEAKGRIFRLQTADNTAILPRSLASRFKQGEAKRVIYDEKDAVPSHLAARLAPHRKANLGAALCACEALLPDTDWAAVEIGQIASSVRLPYRMAEVGYIDGVRIVNDSKATNPASTIAALAALDGPTVLLLGGQAKQTGYEALREAIEISTIRRIVLFGEAAEQLAGLLDGYPVIRVEDVGTAARTGLDAACPGDTILFSPACSSFDQFRSFQERGEAFSRTIRAQAGFRTG